MKPTSHAAGQHAAALAANRQVVVWRVILGACLAVIALLAWMPGHQVPLSSPSDKLNHLLAFAALGFLAWRAYPAHRLLAFLALLGFGGLIEMVQWYLPSRSAEPGDLLADAVGLAIGALTARLLMRRA